MYEKRPIVYILASKKNGVLYIGMTTNLRQRVEQHRAGVVDAFTRKYHVHRLVYFEEHERIPRAAEREWQMKKWKRSWKIELIESLNPNWDDLCSEIPFQ